MSHTHTCFTHLSHVNLSHRTPVSLHTCHTPVLDWLASAAGNTELREAGPSVTRPACREVVLKGSAPVSTNTRPRSPFLILPAVALFLISLSLLSFITLLTVVILPVVAIFPSSPSLPSYVYLLAVLMLLPVVLFPLPLSLLSYIHFLSILILSHGCLLSLSLFFLCLYTRSRSPFRILPAVAIFSLALISTLFYYLCHYCSISSFLLFLLFFPSQSLFFSSSLPYIFLLLITSTRLLLLPPLVYSPLIPPL